MTLFSNNAAAYRTWLPANPLGFVVNAEKAPTDRYLKLHRAACVHIQDWADRNPTSTGYIKICSCDRAELADWALAATGGGRLDPCLTCRPDGASKDGDGTSGSPASPSRPDRSPDDPQLLRTGAGI